MVVSRRELVGLWLIRRLTHPFLDQTSMKDLEFSVE